MFRYYLTIILGAPSVLALIAIFAGDVPPGIAFLAAYSATAATFALDALIACMARLLIPEKRMNPFHPFWKVHHWERKFYVKIGIRRWKDKIPETGGLLVGFSKKNVSERENNAYLLKFIKETCYAELMHTFSAPLGFLVLFLGFAWTSFPFLGYIGLPVAVINGILQMLPVFTQRYVRPFLLSFYRRNMQKEHGAISGKV